MLIRDAVPDDADAIAVLNVAAWRTAFAGVVSDEFLAGYDGAPQKRRADLLTMPPDAVQMVADEHGHVVGWLMGRPSTDDDCDAQAVYEIHGCYVAPTSWRAGIGRRLVQHLFARLEGRAWHEVTLWTPRDTAPTRAFYSSLGFRPDGAKAVIDRGGAVPIVRLRRSLPALAEH